MVVVSCQLSSLSIAGRMSDGVKAAAAPFGEGIVVADYVVGQDHSLGYMVADVFLADEMDNIRFLKCGADVSLDTGQHYLDTFLMG